jgi:DNA-binding beta-propeller fold protein YncE
MKSLFVGALGVVAFGFGLGLTQTAKPIRVGIQPEGGYVVATGQRLLPGAVKFDQRLSDLAPNPKHDVVAVMQKNRVSLMTAAGQVSGSEIALGGDSGFHGMAWTPDGSRLFVSTETGHIQEFTFDGTKLALGAKISLAGGTQKGNPVPGGMCLNRAGTKLFVACADFGGVVEVDLATNQRTKFHAAQMVPFGCKLSRDEKTLLVSNWGGEPPKEGDDTMASGTKRLKITKQGSTATGTVSIIDIASGATTHVQTGFHPTEIEVDGQRAYVACAMSDSIDVLDLTTKTKVASWRIQTGNYKLIGSMPNALHLEGKTLYVADGGDNAICQIDVATGKVQGFRPAGFYPTSVRMHRGKLFALNTKGNGSVRNADKGSKLRNTHDFQGTVSVIDPGANLKDETTRVASLNSWNDPLSNKKPNLKVYQGAIKHVIYVIKENQTYDMLFGDMKEGNGDPSLCILGEKVVPNQRKLSRDFTLLDNSYTSGTNSADGHQWCSQAMANEYLEHFYVGYSRTYPDDGTDALALNSGDRIWDAALKKGLKVRVYGEWADDENPIYKPRKPKDWFEAWEDRQSGKNMFQFIPTTEIPSLKPLLAPGYHYWPLEQSDQSRMDTFEKEFRKFEQGDNLPNLMVMSLPCDHGEGTNPAYPTPRAMQADNDLALGRLVEMVSKSKYWKDTAIIVTEDDSQAGPDHVDGHRVPTQIISAYTKRGYVSSEFLTQVSLHKTMQMMLGFGPLSKFDAIARPATDCFTNTPNFAPFTKVANNVPLDEANPGRKRPMTSAERYWYEKTMSLDWSSMDKADPYWLNRINWFSTTGGTRPYPGRPGERPGMYAEDED